MSSLKNYEQIMDMKNILKIRINNNKKEGEGPVPHLYKYYYDYLIKIAQNFKSLDEEISIYEVVDYIVAHSPEDKIYLVEQIWLSFSKIVSNLKKEDDCLEEVGSIL